MIQVSLTKEGFRQLEEKLEYLKTVRRPEIAEELKEARSHGDLSENAEYDAARDARDRNEQEILDIEEKLRVAVLIEESAPANVVGIGTTVTMKCKNTGETRTYKIVGTTEADPKKGSISNESPVGKAMIGHKLGDTVNVETRLGSIAYEITKVTK